MPTRKRHIGLCPNRTSQRAVFATAPTEHLENKGDFLPILKKLKLSRVWPTFSINSRLWILNRA